MSEHGKKYFQLMQLSAERMRQLIQDLISFSRLRAADRNLKMLTSV
ncbi:MAG: hypothetical protein IPN15_22745 [Saprospiraceae bacterium]|nr:hypothetical protein [Candidatus Vicinibacter affinis]